MKDLVEYIAKLLVYNPEEVSVTALEIRLLRHQREQGFLPLR